MSPQLAALFTQHRTAVLGGGAAAVLALALYKRKTGGTAAAATTAGAAVPVGTMPAGSVAPSSAGYNSSATDIWQALQPELEQLRQQQNMATSASSGITTAPRPVASALFAPSGTGNYVAYPQGTIAEVESDGTQLGLTASEWQKLAAGGASYDMLQSNNALTQAISNGTYFEVQKNLASAKPAS